MFFFYVKEGFYCNHLVRELRLALWELATPTLLPQRPGGTWHCRPPKHLTLQSRSPKNKWMVKFMPKFYTIPRNFSLCILPIYFLLHKMGAIKG